MTPSHCQSVYLVSAVTYVLLCVNIDIPIFASRFQRAVLRAPGMHTPLDRFLTRESANTSETKSSQCQCESLSTPSIIMILRWKQCFLHYNSDVKQWFHETTCLSKFLKKSGPECGRLFVLLQHHSAPAWNLLYLMLHVQNPVSLAITWGTGNRCVQSLLW